MKRCLLILLSLFVLAVPASAAASITFGAEVGTNFTNQWRGQTTADKVVRNLQALYKAGGRVARADSNWGLTEPKAPVHGRHTYQWSWAEVHRNRVLHNSSGKFIAYLPPASNATFAGYATAFMKRYGPHGSFWKANRTLPYTPVTNVEVWNEPDNVHDWGQDINLTDYRIMYEAVRTAVHRVYSHARVMTGGLAWTESSLPRMLKAFRGQPMDALGIHPYGKNPAASIKVAKDALADMAAAGRGRTPVSANEYGWTSIRHTWGSTNPRNVKSYAYNALLGLSKLRLAEIEPFSWADPSWGLSTGSFAKAVAKIQHHR